MSYGEFGIPEFKAGQRVVADDLDIVSRNAARSYSGDEAYVDATGVYPAMGSSGMGLGLRAVKLTENMGATTAKEAAAVFRTFDPATRTYSDTSDTVTVYDPMGIFGHGLEFQYGLVWNHGGISELITLTGEWRVASLTATLNEGGSAAADVVVTAGTASIVVGDEFLGSGDSIASGSDVGIAYDHTGGNWKATEAIC